AVTQMDQATQQNAALVEEMAAAANSLKGQAQELVNTVAVFKVDHHGSGAATPVLARAAVSPGPPPRSAARAAAPAAVAPSRPALPKLSAGKADDGDWKSF
ncbi:MAG: methyl-accepting chemotaxis protein, partial [Curvibacter sp.]